MRRFFLTHQLPPEGVALLERSGEVVLHPDGARTPEAILAGCAGADALMCMLTDPVDEDLITKLTVSVIGTMAVGTDHIDLAAATRGGIPVVHTPGVLTNASADLAWALLMATARRTVEADRFVREDRFRGWEALGHLGFDLHGRTLGVLGFGRIGQAVARRATGFSMKILVHSRTPQAAREAEVGARHVDLETLLRESDVLTIHTPLNPETRGLISAAELALMKPDALLIHTARGGIVDEEALLAALGQGHLGGVGLDVFEGEPGPIDRRWLQAPRTVLSPHIGSATRGTRAAMARLVAQGVLDVLEGRRPQHLANPAVWPP
jgi:glyoxylate reductase